MGPSVGQGEDMMSLSERRRDEFTQHRYYTRSSRDGSATHRDTHSPEARYPPNNATRQQCLHNNNTHMTPAPLKRLVPPPPPPPSESTQHEIDESQEIDTQPDFMMDQITYSASLSVRAPFPSPAMKSTQPFYPFPPVQQQGTPLHEGWGQHHQGGVNGQCILVEAANRAQMAILVDDMGNMGFEPMEQS